MVALAACGESQGETQRQEEAFYPVHFHQGE
jgi:hypothetical protein